MVTVLQRLNQKVAFEVLEHKFQLMDDDFELKGVGFELLKVGFELLKDGFELAEYTFKVKVVQRLNQKVAFEVVELHGR